MASNTLNCHPMALPRVHTCHITQSTFYHPTTRSIQRTTGLQVLLTASTRIRPHSIPTFLSTQLLPTATSSLQLPLWDTRRLPFSPITIPCRNLPCRTLISSRVSSIPTVLLTAYIDLADLRTLAIIGHSSTNLLLLPLLHPLMLQFQLSLLVRAVQIDPAPDVPQTHQRAQVVCKAWRLLLWPVDQDLAMWPRLSLWPKAHPPLIEPWETLAPHK